MRWKSQRNPSFAENGVLNVALANMEENLAEQVLRFIEGKFRFEHAKNP